MLVNVNSIFRCLIPYSTKWILGIFTTYIALFKKIKGARCFEVSAEPGDSAALCEITAVVFQGTRRRRRSSAFLGGIHFGYAAESADPGRRFRKSPRHPRAQLKLSPQKNPQSGGKTIPSPFLIGRGGEAGLSPRGLSHFGRREFGLTWR